MSAISIENLSYAYNKENKVLEDLSLSVPKGAIYGFLGANGTGKSTTIRNIVGLLKPATGKISILGSEVRGRVKVNNKIGSLIESPSLYEHLTAKEHLEIVCQYQNCSYARIDEILEQVGLGKEGKKKANQFSLGMKQRLGLAMALIHDPEILILDEPTVGLDPNGMKDMRDYIQQLSASGKTIFLSSHHLEEVQKIATHIGILKSGKLLFEGTVADLDALRKKDQSLVIQCNRVEEAMKLLKIFDAKIVGNDRLHLNLNSESDVPEVVRSLVQHNIDIYELTRQRNNLEKIFFELTQNK